MSARHRGRGRPDASGVPWPSLPVDLNTAGAAQPPAVAVVELEVQLEVEGETIDPFTPSLRRPSCTLAQLRRFVKSRQYVPLHELRRRFGIEGYEDEVSSFRGPEGMLYVGLPPAEAQLLGELVRGGEVGFEPLLDPTCPAIVGVFPMRPIARA